MVENKILIVDDDVDHLCLVERYVAFYSSSYVSAKNGIEALSILETMPISLVVTDMVMPEMDGMQLLVQIKELYPTTDVIVMTGYSQDYSYIDFIKAGAADFIAKPFRNDELMAKLERVFRERRILKELTEARDNAEVSNRAKADFIHRISHEFKTPLTNIVGFSELLLNTEVEAKSREYKKAVSEAVSRLTSLINQLLEFSDLSDHVRQQKCTEFNLTDLFAGLCCDFTPQVEAKGLSLRYTVDESLVAKTLCGAYVSLSNILNNLLKNAITFSEQGEICIGVKAQEPPGQDSCILLFSIQDSGCGIAQENLGIIFEPFTQIEEFLTRTHDGAGLGLAICAKLIKSLGGEIWATSEVGKGSVFNFTLAVQVL